MNASYGGFKDQDLAGRYAYAYPSNRSKEQK
jgi:hypothetical protein